MPADTCQFILQLLLFGFELVQVVLPVIDLLLISSLLLLSLCLLCICFGNFLLTLRFGIVRVDIIAGLGASLYPQEAEAGIANKRLARSAAASGRSR